MICQTESVKTKTGILPAIHKQSFRPASLTFLPAHKAEDRLAWSPLTAGPFMVPVTRWVE